MSDLLVQFDEPQLSADGRMWIAEVRGTRRPNGLWEAWIEFQPRIGGDSVRTARQTEQLSRGDLRFWAAGITRDHLQAALTTAIADRATATQCGYERPCAAATNKELDSPAEDDVLDPFAVYRHSGEYALRQELRALDAAQLGEVIGRYRIAELDVLDLARTYEDALAERIVADVQHNVASDQPRSGTSEIPTSN